MIYSRPSETIEPVVEGAPTGLVGTIGVRIIDQPGGATVLARTTAGITEQPPGSGLYGVALPAPAVAGSYLVVWDTGGALTPDNTSSEELLVSPDVTQPVVPPAYSGYPPSSVLVAASTVAQLTSLTEDQQDALREVSISAVERYTGQNFESEEATKVLDGHGGRELYLERRLEAIDSIAIKGTSIDLTDVVLSERRDRLHFAPFSAGYAVQAMRETAYDSRTFRSGSGVVSITGTWGWPAVPPAVVQAIRLDMEDQAVADSSKMAGSVAAYRRLGLRDISQGNLRATIGNPSLVAPRVAALLEPYIWLGPSGYVL